MLKPARRRLSDRRLWPTRTSPAPDRVLRARLGPPPESTSRQATQQSILTNASADQCVLTGFPDVSLVGTAHHPDRGTKTEQYRRPLEHVVRDAPAVPVPPSGEVRVPTTYFAAREGSASMTTTSIELQLPGAATPIVIPWASDISLSKTPRRALAPTAAVSRTLGDARWLQRVRAAAGECYTQRFPG